MEVDPPALPPQLDQLHHIGNPLRARNWPRFYNRPIVKGPSVVLEETEEQCALLYDYLLGMGWGSMLVLPHEVYPLAVRLFYNNLSAELGADGLILRSYVLGMDIRVDRNTMKEVHEFTDGDLRAYFSTDDELRQVRESIDNSTGLQQILSAACHTRTTPGAVSKNDLKLEYHILHLWLRHNVLLSKGHYHSITPFELYLFYCLQEGVSLDLPTIILNEMVKISQANNRALGYGALLTLIFRSCNVDLSAEISIPTSMPINHYTIERSHVLERLAERGVEDARGPDVASASTSADVPQVSTSDPCSSAIPSSSGGFRSRTTAQLEEIYHMLAKMRETQRMILERLPPPPSQP